MGFAEQLAARAAETQSHNSRTETGGRRRRRLTPPRPGKINRGGGAGSSAAAAATSPSLFADQLKQRKAQRHAISNMPKLEPNAGAGSTGSKASVSMNNSFASQITSPSDADDSSWVSRSTAQSRDAHSTAGRSKVGRERSHKILMPSCESSKSNGEESEEDDEYASVGFSLMDASTVSTDEGGESKVNPDKPASRKMKPTTTAANPAATTTAYSSAGASHNMHESDKQMKGHAKVESPSNVQRQEIPFQANGLSPIKRKEMIHPPKTFPSQEHNDSELQTRLQEQYLKSQTVKHANTQNISQLRSQSEPDKTVENRGGGQPGNSKVFGAWSQIESLQRRVREAEERALHESQRAEMASYELRMAKERHGGNSSAVDVARDSDANSSLAGDSISKGGASVDAGVHDPVRRKEKEVMDDLQHVKQVVDPHRKQQKKVERTSSSQDTAQGEVDNSASSAPQGRVNREDSDEEEAQQWKQRALEAEERLAKEVERLKCAAGPPANSTIPQSVVPSQPTHSAPTPTSVAASNISHFEESDLIRLKNAEIDVLRNQIHRLERRIQEETERNEDLLRSSYHHLHHHGDTHPPLVVASECMTTSTPRSDMDEFRILRNEIRHLQYQLHAKDGNRNGATTSTGESTLSSLDGNENNYDDEEGEGVEDEDDGNAVSASSSWGLCCFRGGRSRRGYGRV